MSYVYSDDPDRLDRDRVHRWLSEQSYWAEGRPRAVQDAAIDGSLNFGAYETDTGEQVAYARLVTDGATFAWLCDVFVDPAARGDGLGIGLVERVCSTVDALGLSRTLLATGDAHGLYEKFGFRSLDEPQRWMARSRT